MQKVNFKLAILWYCFMLLGGNISGSTATVASDFTIKDVTGKTHNLYSYLQNGKSVILNFSSTWCKPCWNYEKSGTLQKVWETFGPEGKNEVMVIFIEADEDTCEECVFGQEDCNDFTYGNWSENGYPTVSLNASTFHLNETYQVERFPSIIGISAKDFTISNLGQLSTNNFYSWISKQSDRKQFAFLDRVAAKKFSEINKTKRISSIADQLQLNSPISISIYPNPCSEVLNISVNDDNESTYGFSLIDSNGSRITKGIPYNIHRSNESISIGHLKSGVYYAQVTNGNSITVKKVLVVK